MTKNALKYSSPTSKIFERLPAKYGFEWFLSERNYFSSKVRARLIQQMRQIEVCKVSELTAWMVAVLTQEPRYVIFGFRKAGISLRAIAA